MTLFNRRTSQPDYDMQFGQGMTVNPGPKERIWVRLWRWLRVLPNKLWVFFTKDLIHKIAGLVIGAIVIIGLILAVTHPRTIGHIIVGTVSKTARVAERAVGIHTSSDASKGQSGNGSGVGGTDSSGTAGDKPPAKPPKKTVHKPPVKVVSVGQPSTTALTIVATDGVASNAVCINTTAGGVTACMQANPSNTVTARFGSYNVASKIFAPKTNWLGWSSYSLVGKGCSNGHRLYGFSLGGHYYGQEYSSSSQAKIGSMNGSGGCSSSGGGSVNATKWASALVSCSGATAHVASSASLVSSVAAGSKVVCVAPGHYSLNTSLRPKAGTKIIGDPLRRADINTSGIPQGNGTTSAFTGGSDVTLANLVVHGSKGAKSTGCSNCGYGIDAGDRVTVYNVKMYGNFQNGFHYHNRKANDRGYLVENSEISNNGNKNDVGGTSASSGGLKTTHGGTIINSVVAYNWGNGLWCDGLNDLKDCNGGAWHVYNNYIAHNTRAGALYEIAFGGEGAVMSGNVVVDNNTEKLSYVGGLDAYGKKVTITQNSFYSSNINAIFVYNDSSRIPPSSSYITATSNYMHGGKVKCVAGNAIVCSPNH